MIWSRNFSSGNAVPAEELYVENRLAREGGFEGEKSGREIELSGSGTVKVVDSPELLILWCLLLASTL